MRLAAAAVLAAAILVGPGTAQAAGLEAGVAVVDASWHVGASAGQYALRARLPGARSLRVGANRWYLVAGRRARLVFRVRGGRVREVGIADLAATRGPKGAGRFVRGFS